MAQWQKLERGICAKIGEKKNSPLKTTGRCAQSESTTAAKAQREEKKVYPWLVTNNCKINTPEPNYSTANGRAIYSSIHSAIDQTKRGAVLIMERCSEEFMFHSTRTMSIFSYALTCVIYLSRTHKIKYPAVW